MKTNPLAVASLIASLLMCFLGFNSVVAIGLGFIALGQIKRRPDLHTGAGLARLGIVLGVLGIGGMVSCGVSMGNKIQSTKPIASEVTHLLVAGDTDGARVLVHRRQTSRAWVRRGNQTTQRIAFAAWRA